MKIKEQPFESGGHDLAGFASLDFYAKQNFNTFARNISGYNPDRFDPIALKIYVQHKKVIVTLYALDKFKQLPPAEKSRLPVRKFKIRISWLNLLSQVKHFDLILSEGKHDIKEMLVMNK